MKNESIIKDFFLTLLTLGLYNFYVQFRQIEDVNYIYKQDKHSLTRTFLYSVLTFGFYFCYHEYKLTLDLQEKAFGSKKAIMSLWVFPATFFGIWAVVDSYQQALLNSLSTTQKGLSFKNIAELVIVSISYVILISYLITFMLSAGEINHPLEFFF